MSIDENAFTKAELQGPMTPHAHPPSRQKETPQ